MTQVEFFERTGIEMSASSFESVHRIYMDTTMDKDDFCKMWKSLKKEAKEEMDYISRCKANDEADRDFWKKAFNDEQKRMAERNIEMGKFLADEAHEYSSMKAREKAIEMMGFKAYIGYKMLMGYGMWEIDNEQILEHLS